jgi:hypothetical protein
VQVVTYWTFLKHIFARTESNIRVSTHAYGLRLEYTVINITPLRQGIRNFLALISGKNSNMFFHDINLTKSECCGVKMRGFDTVAGAATEFAISVQKPSITILKSILKTTP